MQQRLKNAETIVEVPKKVSELLGILTVLTVEARQ